MICLYTCIIFIRYIYIYLFVCIRVYTYVYIYIVAMLCVCVNILLQSPSGTLTTIYGGSILHKKCMGTRGAGLSVEAPFFAFVWNSGCITLKFKRWNIHFCLQFAVACASGAESAMAWFHTFCFDMRIRGVRKQTFTTLWMIPDLYEMQGIIYWVLGFTRHYRRLLGNPQVWNWGRKIRRQKCMAWVKKLMKVTPYLSQHSTPTKNTPPPKWMTGWSIIIIIYCSCV